MKCTGDLLIIHQDPGPQQKLGMDRARGNGILTGMYMNCMYTLGTHTVTDHEPLIHIYNDPRRPKQLRVDRHRTKLPSFEYNIVFKPGKDTPCTYGSRHPPQLWTFTEDQKQQWAIENDVDFIC